MQQFDGKKTFIFCLKIDYDVCMGVSMWYYCDWTGDCRLESLFLESPQVKIIFKTLQAPEQ
jgi:hypothetical protein